MTSAGPLVEFAVLVSPTLKPGTGLPAEQIGAADRLRRMAQDDIIDLIRLSAVLTSDASELRREGLCWGLPTVQTKMGEVWMVPPFKRTADASPWQAEFSAAKIGKVLLGVELTCIEAKWMSRQARWIGCVAANSAATWRSKSKRPKTRLRTNATFDL